MTPDLECTLWPDGWPAWLGGTGREWLHCCIEHDLSPLPWWRSDMNLAGCVAAAGFPVMSGIMLAGLATLGVIYRLTTRK